MDKIEELRKSLVLTEEPEEGFEKRFEKIAKNLFNNFIIKTSYGDFRFEEIEFYFHSKKHADYIAHPRKSEPLIWYINDFGGIDLNFGSKIRYEKRLNSNGKKVEKCVLDDSAYFGGILIRQLISEDGCEILSGPLACAELFRCHNATGVDKEFPVLVDNNAIVKYIRKPRVNLLRSKQSVEDKVNNILYQYHDNIQSFKETLYQDFINFKDKPYGYEQQIASR